VEAAGFKYSSRQNWMEENDLYPVFHWGCWRSIAGRNSSPVCPIDCQRRYPYSSAYFFGQLTSRHSVLWKFGAFCRSQSAKAVRSVSLTS